MRCTLGVVGASHLLALGRAGQPWCHERQPGFSFPFPLILFRLFFFLPQVFRQRLSLIELPRSKTN